MSYALVADSNSDLPYTHVDALDIQMIYMPYMLDNDEHFADLGRNPETLRNFYAAMRQGASAKTSLLPTAFYLDFFTPILEQGHDILYIAFSFKMSKTQANAIAAAEELKKTYPDRRIEVIDTYSISMGYGILLYEAAQLRQRGSDMDELIAFVEANRTHSHHWFSVEDLVYLKRGGRLSASAAMFGTLLDVKPLLTVDRSGTIYPAEKTKGRKKALRTLAQRTLENLPEDCSNTIVVVVNADCMEDARYVEGLLKEKVTPRDIWHVPVGQVICSHCGPGTVGILFIGKERAAQ